METAGVPEFVRTIFASQQTAEVWKPRLEEINTAWARVEVESVAQRLRNSALIFATPGELPALSAWCQLHELRMVPLEETNLSGQVKIRTAVTRGDLDWHRLWEKRDDEAIGAALGFPSCCRDFFLRTWAKGDHDPTFAAALGQKEVGGMHPGNNILLRWLGVRLVTHLPCSFKCTMTSCLADAFMEVGRNVGHGRAMKYAMEMLAEPMTYSSYHGVGIVKTPQLRLEFNSDYRDDPAGFIKLLDPLPLSYEVQPSSWEDNGFSSEDVMKASHKPIQVLCPRSYGRIMDLGCGDGSLLMSLFRPGNQLYGIDSDKERIRRGQGRYAIVSLSHQSIEDWAEAPGDPFDLVLFMPGRLREIEESRREKVIAALKTARRLIVYAYGDWLAQQNLKALSRATLGVEPAMTVKATGCAAEAGVIQW